MKDNDVDEELGDLDDLRLAVALAQMWDELDPVPDELAESVILTLAMSQLDAEVELLSLVVSDEPEPTRGLSLGSDDTHTMTFSNDRVTVMVAMSARPRGRVRIDGWIDGPGGGTVSVRHADGQRDTVTVEPEGRFVLDGLRPGVIRMEYRDSAGRAVAAPTFAI